MSEVHSSLPHRLKSRLLLPLLESTFMGSFLILRTRHVRTQPCWTRLAASLAVDFVLGLLLSRLLLNNSLGPKTVTALTLSAMENVVGGLKTLVTWLMGAPAGLKLNSVLSAALGKFFLYHIHLWVTFLYLATPFVSEALSWSMHIVAYCGLCLQLCLAQDAFNVVTFHIHCFYAYARRLCLSQTAGLTSLWRLFRGKKYNPLRKRVDTHEDTTVDQLFVGTVAFTILLFLYPTTLMYFAVFKVLEVGLVSVNAAVSKMVHLVAFIGLSGEPEAREEELVRRPYFALGKHYKG